MESGCDPADFERDQVFRRDALAVAYVAAPGLIHAVKLGHDPADLGELAPTLMVRPTSARVVDRDRHRPILAA